MKPLSLTFAMLLAAEFVSLAVAQAPGAQTSDPATILRPYVTSQYHPRGDYVPCMFDADQAMTMRTRPLSPPKSVLDPTGAQAFVDLARSQILAQFGVQPATKPGELPPAKALQDTNVKSLSDALDPNDFVGLTISKAIDNLASASKAKSLKDSQTQTLVSNLKSEVGVGGDQRPEDVSCSFSILPWEETNYFFGRMVANTYVAIEVNVRNLNSDSEFLLHDIQVAVDTGLDADSFGRFEAGRDKMIVRGVAKRGESDDPRNRIMNALAAVGAVAGGASGALTQTIGRTGNSAFATGLSSSVSIFQGPLLSGLSKIWPDHTIDNVNNVSDLAFSASSTLKTVIATQGAAPLVTFIAQKPLGQLPFARCGKKSSKVGFDFCSLKADSSSGLSGFDESSLSFHFWQPAALNALKHRTYVVVAGVHIQEVSTNALVNSISCPTLTDGTIDLSAKDVSGDVSCTIAGKNMDKASSAKLEQGKNKSVSSTITPASDGNSATLSFKASDFAGQSGTFELFSDEGTGKETNLNQSLKFAARPPVIDSVQYVPASVTAAQVAAGASLTVTVTGSNLDRIADVYLTDRAVPTNSETGAITDAGKIRASAKSITVTFLKVTLANSGTAGIQYDTLDDTATTKSKVSVTTPKDPGFPF